MFFSVFAKVFKFAIALFSAEFVVFVPGFFTYTAPAPSLPSIGLIGEQMTPLAMCLACVDCRGCIRSNCVFSFGYKFEMIWIDTNWIFANHVVNAPLSAFCAGRYGSFCPRKQYSVDEMFGAAIGRIPTVLAFRAHPYPATRFGVYFDFGKYALVFDGGKLNREILDLIHAVYSFAVDGVARADAVRQHCVGSFSILRTRVLVNTPSWFWIKE